jgi:hypothetical protein
VRPGAIHRAELIQFIRSIDNIVFFSWLAGAPGALGTFHTLLEHHVGKLSGHSRARPPPALSIGSVRRRRPQHCGGGAERPVGGA